MSQETPNSPNQFIAKILEDALVHALKPVIKRLDLIEDRLIDQDCFPRHAPQLEMVTNQVQKLTNQLNRMEEKLDQNLEQQKQRLGRQDQELLEMSAELTLVGEDLRGVAKKLRYHNEQYGQIEQRFRESNQQYGRVQQDFRELANQARNMRLEDIIQRLGLEPDRHDHHKYKSDAHIISITQQRFYDHLNEKGGGGAIDLVMHVNDCDFKEAVEWLNGNSINFTPIKTAHSFKQSQPTISKPFEPPVADESRWAAVKDYLVNTRQLAESTIDYLHKNGSIYADSKQNVVFIRRNMTGKVTGASLRGTYDDSRFKGLAKGTSRDAGWFAFQKGKGELERIVLTESPIDAISAAAVSQRKETTLFFSTDGAGSAPIPYLQQKLVDGKKIIIAFDNDEAGNHMARTVMEKLPGSYRVAPRLGKDWNEQILYSQGTKEQKKTDFQA